MEWLFPASILYTGVQSYTVYHVLSSPKKLRKPKSPPVELDEREEEVAASRKHLIEKFIYIYQLKYNKDEDFEILAEDVSFEDPVVFLKGINSLKNGLNLAKAFIKGVEMEKLEVHHYEREIRMDLTQKYTYRLGFTATASTALYLRLDGEAGEEKVTSVVEEWGKKCLLDGSNAPYTGNMAIMFRKIHGKVCDIIRVCSRN